MPISKELAATVDHLTRNVSYNACLLRWNDGDLQRAREAAICEHCDRHLLGEDVVEVPCAWLCQDCAEIEAEHWGDDVDDREDFHADG
jgi:hypothetical protein